ncbi:hypothetical protein P261_02900 [Lachnospiraceae bacterium TWA4]|nr:hypothetical protein P261_02900 [Lachnospiraceae bacterium TWA4]
MLSNHPTKKYSEYSILYDMIVPNDHILRKIKKVVDFSFVYDELKNNYCLDNGRNAKSPILLFKYLLLKYLYNLSDEGVVERSKYDLSFKYFLDMIPEEDVIHPSLLTKFRKQRLKNQDLLDLLIAKTVEIAIQQKVLKSCYIIIDSTHTHSKYHKATKKELLLKTATKLRTIASEKDYRLKLPIIKKSTYSTTKEIENYCIELQDQIKQSGVYSFPSIKEASTFLDELLDNQVNSYEYSFDPDARIGYKTVNNSFYGYKSHIAMSDERIITAATITSGDKFDGTELPKLVEKSRLTGMKVAQVIADTAYSGIENLRDAEKSNYELISKLNPSIVNGTRKDDEFYFNKDAGMMQCPAGHLAIRKSTEPRNNTGKNPRIRYYFDIKACKKCHKREGCYKPESKSKTYGITIKSDYYKSQELFQNSQEFKEKNRMRYKIEAKNSELKNLHGYDQCDSFGLKNMELQGAMTIFVVNLKRILKLMGEVCPKNKNSIK